MPDAAGSGEGVTSLPPHLMPYLERRSIPEGTVLIRQGDPPDDLFVLESGRLRVEFSTPEGERRRLTTVRPGVMVGEMAPVHGRSPDGGRDRRDAVRGPRPEPGLARPAGGGGAGDGRGVAPMARDDAGGATHRRGPGVLTLLD